MKKILTLAIGLIAATLNAQTWAPCGAGVTNQVYGMETYAGNLYISNYTLAPGNIDRWNGTSVSNVCSSGPAFQDLAASSTTIYATGFTAVQGLYSSATGNSGTWAQIGSNLGGPDQLCWFNSQLYKASNSLTSRLVGVTWTNLVGGGMSVGPYEAKVNGTSLYYCGRVVSGPNYYGFRAVDMSNNITYYGPTVTSVQAVTDFAFNGPDLYANISGTGGGLMKQVGATWLMIQANTSGGRCEMYGGKLYFSQTTGVNTSIYVYDPAMPLSVTNPSSIAVCSSSGLVKDMIVYGTSLYIGGQFTNMNTVSSGLVTANNIIRFSVPFPSAAFTYTPGSMCGLDTATLTNTSTGAVTYQWYVNGATYATSTNTTVNSALYTLPNPYSAASYTVCLTAINGVLRDSVTQVINTLANPLPGTVTASGPTTFCSGGSVTLMSTPAAGYLWSSGPTTSTISAVSSGTYFVYAVSGGCKTKSTNSITVTVNPNPVASITPGGPTTFCNGDSVVLNAGGGGTYSWSPIVSSSSSVTATNSGVYTVTVTAGGCSATATQSVTVNPLPTPVVTPSGTNLTTGVYSTYQWLFNNAVIPLATSQTYTPTSNGNYAVIVTNSFGCSDTSAVYNWISTGINSLSNNAHYSVYKKDDVIFVSLEKRGRVEVYDLMGKLVYSSTEQNHEIRVGSGVFVVRSEIFVCKIGL